MTTSPTPVGHVIHAGEPLPGDVTSVRDRDEDFWVLSDRGHWHSRGWHRRCDATCTGGGVPKDFCPLTVTAVREPEPPRDLSLLPRMHCYTSEPHEPHEWTDVDTAVCCWGEPARNPKRSITVEIATAGPLVLSLPEVPEGTVALIGVESGNRWDFSGKTTTFGNAIWTCAALCISRTTAGVLTREKSVSVVMREPRTWPRLDGPPVGVLKVRDAEGDVWEICSSGWTNTGGADSLSWSSLREFRGPLTEVFDEPGGQP